MGISYCFPAELYFLSLICAFHDEEARVKWCPPPPREEPPIWFDPLRPLAFVAIGFCICSKANQFLAKQISCRGIPSIPRLPRVTWPPTSPMDYAGLSPLYTVHRPVFDYIQILFKTHLRDDMLCQISQRTIQRSWLFCARSLTTLPWQHLLQTLLLKHGLP